LSLGLLFFCSYIGLSLCPSFLIIYKPEFYYCPCYSNSIHKYSHIGPLVNLSSSLICQKLQRTNSSQSQDYSLNHSLLTAIRQNAFNSNPFIYYWHFTHFRYIHAKNVKIISNENSAAKRSVGLVHLGYVYIPFVSAIKLTLVTDLSAASCFNLDMSR